MKLTTARVLLTGAAGGIGSAIARELVARGAEVLLVDMNEAALRRLVEGPLAAHAAQVDIHAGNLTRPEERTRVAEVAARWRGGVNVLVNNAGVSHFRLLDEQPAEEVDLAVAVNLQAPIHLCRLLLPHLKRQPEAQILNTGSVFGGIGYAAYAVYSATKFGIRGFTEALRRELADTTVQVHYLAPRATRTGINTAAVEQMNAELKVAMDPPPVVALAACDMLEAGTPEAVIGWPEKFFVRLNALLPRLVDGSLRKQLPVIRRYAGVRAAASDHSLQAPRTTP
ncbi:MAG: SDR family oxidoreductase [Gammaproteobacteria bacterium]|nr:SDR family oxidoreductase [Gammaproteobacteria bacterium]